MNTSNHENEIILARYLGYSSRVPTIAMAGLCGVISQSVILHGYVPWHSSILAPLAFGVTAIAVTFLYMWERRSPPTVEQAKSRTKRDGVILIASGVAACAEIATLPNLDATIKFYVLFHSTLFAFGCFVSFIHLWRPATISAGIQIGGVVVIILSFGVIEALALITTLLICCSLVYVSMQSHDRDFTTLVLSRAEMRSLNTENSRLAQTDTLTGLRNRREFFAQLKERMAVGSGSGLFSIGLIDLDAFKPINDTYGHHTGDRVLRAVAHRLMADPSWQIEVFRLGGDEFAVFFNGPASETERIGNEIVAAVSRRISVGAFTLGVGCSIGVASCRDAPSNASELYEAADFALYEAKRAGRGRVEVFSAAHKAKLLGQTEVERALRQADADAEFHAVFQPIVDATTGQTLAFECLARWNSPVLGPVPPSRFVPIAEKAGLSALITMTILRKALAAARSWPQHVSVSINLSAEDVQSASMAHRLIDEVARSGIEARRVTFELTETALLNDINAARNFVDALREAGHYLALDDFGTGYSSLSHVQKLPLDRLKIDRSFIQDITTNVTSQSIVRSLMVLCQGIDIDCVVEGVETQEQIDTLQALGCTRLQGYFYSRPMPAEDVGAFLASDRAVSHAA